MTNIVVTFAPLSAGIGMGYPSTAPSASLRALAQGRPWHPLRSVAGRRGLTPGFIVTGIQRRPERSGWKIDCLRGI
jgi:hypothetical protein